MIPRGDGSSVSSYGWNTTADVRGVNHSVTLQNSLALSGNLSYKRQFFLRRETLSLGRVQWALKADLQRFEKDCTAIQSQQDCGKIFVPESKEGTEQMDTGH
ncbi:hypothetical protein ROHU_029513 [Labeo rohita]|uniref:Uncharacterized protein n=1 Tax=Labeo rohita TaxID=84645 RepID=A0A498M0G9_LABRO|nr:hypothetical protein ROHU_029513 [Labeo rohita]